MDVIKKIDKILKERDWTDYKLAKESGLSTSTIANLRRRDTVPSIATLECICNAFGITLSQFFYENEECVNLNKDQQKLFKKRVTLTKNQKQLIYKLIAEFK